jgi:hypothetical protein
MRPLNLKRILLGGLLAGLVVNITETFFNLVLVGKAMENAFKLMNLPPFGPSAMAYYTAWGFIQGLLSVWLYAAIRSQYGPGPKTAIRAGLLVWALAYAFPNMGFAFMGMAPWSVVSLTLVWSLVEAPLVTIVGARFYKD